MRALHNLHQPRTDEKPLKSGTLRGVFDIAVNLADEKLRTDAAGVLTRARDAGVDHCLLVGTDIQESRWLAERAPALQQPFTAGIHPHYVKDRQTNWLTALRELAAEPGCVAVGETGLDFFRMLSHKAEQIDSCQAHLDLAMELKLPVYLHDREASDELISILNPRARLSGVVHCFTGSQAALEAYLDLGLSIGITAWCLDERRGQDLAKLVPMIPGDRLMVETDAPYLTPRDLRPRPKRNEPQFLPHIIEGIARLRGESPEHLARQTTDNARRLFAC